MNAIILAAGMGTRLLPYTDKKPKSLIPIKNEPIIERQIRFLNEANIENITIVVGYLAEQFEYLVEKYQVNLIYNPLYDKYNNLYSLFLARNYLDSTYIIEADVFLLENIFLKSSSTNNSIEYAINRLTDQEEWVLSFDKNMKINSFDIKVPDRIDYTLSGISYWAKNESFKLKKWIEQSIENNEGLEYMYWDSIVKDNLENIQLYMQVLEPRDCYEVDTAEQLHTLEGLIDEEIRYAKINREYS